MESPRRPPAVLGRWLAGGRRLGAAVRRWYRDLGERVAGPKVTEPLVRNPLVAAGCVAYAVLLAVSLLSVSAVAPVRATRPPGVRAVGPLVPAVLVVAMAGWTVALPRSDRLFAAGLPWVNLRSAGTALVYVVAANVGSTGFSVPFFGATLLHGAVLGVLFEVYSRPLVPALPRGADDARARRYLDVHLTNWWRTTQVALSAAIAVGVGLITQFYLTVQQDARITFFVYFAGPLAVGMAAFLLYTFWKMRAVEARLRPGRSR